MSCPQTLGPGLAGLSAAIHTGEVATTRLFQTYREACSTEGGDASLDEVVDTIDDKAMCQVMCCCKDMGQRQECVRQTLDQADDLLGGTSRYKAEISYNMLAEAGPTPFMHRDQYGRDTTVRSERWQTRAHREIRSYRAKQGHVRRPDVVIVSDPTRPPTQDNLRRVIEMKFRRDREGPDQYQAYERIAGDRDKFKVIEEGDCRCGDDDSGLPNLIPEAVSQSEGKPSAWEIPLWGVATAVGTVATAALALFPFEGPVGETAAGAATAAAAARFAAAWRAVFTAAPAAGGMIR